MWRAKALNPQVRLFPGCALIQVCLFSSTMPGACCQSLMNSTNVTELRSFLGLASYYRRFIHHFAEVAAPLYRLQEKGSTFRWIANCTDAFEMLKKKLTSAPILAFPRPSDTFLDTDASECGIGAVLSQRQEGIERVIAYGSRIP